MTKSREVADYLKKNPNFFTENRDLLAGLELPEQPELPGLPGTAPVHERIHERQVRALRTRHDLQQAKLDLMVDTVKNNQALERGVHQFAVTLLNLEDLDPANPDAPALLVKSRFDVDNVAVFLSSRQQDFSPEVDYSLLCRRVEHLGSVCDDRISSKLGAGLFPRAGAIESCAFIPVVHRQKLSGVMVLGAADKQRFQPGMGVWILDRLGELIGAYLAGRDLI